MSDTSPEQTAPVILSPRARGLYRRGGGYINRYKFQRERLRALQNVDESVPALNRTTFHRANLPKLPQGPHLEREISNLSSASSKSIETIKLPTVASSTKVGQYIKNHPPTRSFHFKLYPDHYSRIARSLPSLPSIPGSPHPLHTITSPSPEPEQPAAPVHSMPIIIPSKHRFEVIAFQKTIHPEKAELQTLLPVKEKKKSAYHLDTIPHSPLTCETDDKVTSQKHQREVNKLRPVLAAKPPPGRSHRRFRSDRFCDTKSDGDIHIRKKWKDHCGCLRCQMIKRQWQEGDELYKVWGNYPCHHIDPAAMADDDDD